MRGKNLLFLKILLSFIIAFLFIGSILFLSYLRDFPIPEKFTERYLPQSTKIYDRTGKVLLYEIYGEEKRTVVPLSVIPPYLKEAVIVTEDADFYKHRGIDIKSIFRAILTDLKLREPVQGGSTISQQLIRSTFLTREKTIKRKTKEIIATFLLEKRYSKDQILEFYLNQIPFGSNCYGVESASETFFNKKVQDLSLEESAILAALIRAPSRLSPYGEHKNELLERKNWVLDRMAQKGYVTKKEAEEAKKKEIYFRENKTILRAPHFSLHVKELLDKEYGEDFLKTAGFKVYTTLNWDLQQKSQKIIQKESSQNKKYHAFNAALVVLNPKNGDILSLIGSKNWFAEDYPLHCREKVNCLFEPKFDVAVLGKRQPGSAFKPFAYAKAFQKGFTPNTPIWDVETNFDTSGLSPYLPENYDNKFRGSVTFKQSLAQSINVPSVKVLYLAGLKNTMELARKMGITTLNKEPNYYGLPLVLGGGEVNLLEMTSAYGVFATDGFKVNPRFIIKIENSKGEIIKNYLSVPKKILESNVCREVSSILSDNEARAPVFGWQSPLYFNNYQVAVKTGTTQNFNDAWTIGYTPSMVVGVWVGNNDNSSMTKPGVVLAGPIFHQVLAEILPLFPKKNFIKPKILPSSNPILNGGDLDSHSILYYIKKEAPLGPPPENPDLDPQFKSWEKGVKNWLEKHPKSP